MAMVAYSNSSGVLMVGCALPLWVLPLSHTIGVVVEGLLLVIIGAFIVELCSGVCLKQLID